MKVISREQKIIVKEITLETIEERAIILAMIDLAKEDKNFPRKAEKRLFKSFGVDSPAGIESEKIQEVLQSIQIQMY